MYRAQQWRNNSAPRKTGGLVAIINKRIKENNVSMAWQSINGIKNQQQKRRKKIMKASI